MSQHIEWMNAGETVPTVDYPGAPEHPARNAEDDSTAATHFALTLWSDEAVVIEGSADELAALLEAAAAALVTARFTHRIIRARQLYEHEPSD